MKKNLLFSLFAILLAGLRSLQAEALLGLGVGVPVAVAQGLLAVGIRRLDVGHRIAGQGDDVGALAGLDHALVLDAQQLGGEV